MTIPTIHTELTDAEKEVLSFRGKTAKKALELSNGTKYALALLELHDDVTPDDYGTLASGITDVTGIQGIQLVLDHETEAVISENHTQVADISASIRLRQDPPVEP